MIAWKDVADAPNTRDLRAIVGFRNGHITEAQRVETHEGKWIFDPVFHPRDEAGMLLWDEQPLYYIPISELLPSLKELVSELQSS